MLSWTAKCSTRWNCSSSTSVLGLFLLAAAIFLLCVQPSVKVELISTNANLIPLSEHLSLNITREKYFLVFIIPSHPAHSAVRNTIRQTWMNVSRWNDLSSIEEQYKRIKVLFIFGSYTDKGDLDEEFYDEMRANSDMYLVSDLREHRTALKYKIMWGMKQVLYRYDFQYVAKTDDDVVVNLPKMISDLRTLPRERFYTGSCKMGYGGFRGYPKWRYCSGGGYVLSRDVISKFQQLPSSVHDVPFRPEDAYTGYLVNRVRALLEYDVTMYAAKRAKISRYVCGPFVHWFYHCCKTTTKHEDFYGKVSSNSVNACP